MQLTLFGGFQLFDDTGNPVELSARKTKALLAWLAMHQDKRQARDRLAVLLWEESDDTQARHSLRQALSGLRKALGTHADALVTDQESVMLKSEHVQVDANRFESLIRDAHSSEALGESVSLYGGEFLEGFNPRSNGYEEWLMTQRSHFREQAVKAMGELLQHYLETQQLESGVRLAIQLLSSDPLQEQVHRTLMQIYARMNRPADALRQYRQCRKVMLRELGLAPEPETNRLYREIAQSRGQSSAKEQPLPDEVNSSDRLEGTAVPLNADGAVKPLPATTQQLRPVTVLHLQMGRFLELVCEVNPEELQQKTAYLHERIEGLLQRCNGLLHLQRDDAMVVLFGLPTAYGNECEKAVQLAWAVHGHGDEAFSRAARELGLQAGISSGSVLYDGERVVSGAVFAQAEQLARSGDPGQTLLTETAYRTLRLPVVASKRGDAHWQLESLSPEASLTTRGTPFVGRARELRQFGAALEACVDDRVGETFLIRGEAGIGKTRLVEEVTQQASRLGIACHHTLVLDFGMELQGEPIPGLLRQLMDFAESATARQIEAQARLVMGEAWNELLHLQALHALFRLPIAQTGAGQQASLSDEALHLGSNQLLHRLLASAADAQPRLLVVEDIHWADKQTLAQVAELATIVSRCAALLIITSRVEGEPLDPAWRSAMHGAPLTTLDLGPLGQDQAASLAAELQGGNAEFVRRCIERAGGNPFYLEQLLWGTAGCKEGVPDSVQSLVLTRLDILAERDRCAARAASALGQRFRLAPLLHVMQDEGYQADQLLSQRLIRPEGEGFLFSHALLREGIYASLLPAQRRTLHLRAAEWYRQSDPALHARHLDLADDPGAEKAYLDAAQAAVRAFDFEQAITLATRGVEIARTADCATRLNLLCGELLVQSGVIEEAKQAFESAAHSAGEERQRARALIGMATCLTVQDRLDEALAALDEAQPLTQRLAQQGEDQALQTELHYRRGDILFALARVDECLVAHQQAEQLAQSSHAPLLEIRALAGMADAYYACGKMKTASNHLQRCIDLARAEKRLPQELGNLSMLGLTRFYNGSVSTALADTLEAAKLGAQYGNLRAELFGYVNTALIKLYTEDIEGAERSARHGLALAKQLGASRFYCDNLVAIGEALVLQGELDEGLEYIEQAYRASLQNVPTYYCAFVLGVLARLTPDDQRRRQAIDEGQRWLNSESLSHNHLHYYQNLIEVCLKQQDTPGALHYATALERYTAQEPLAWSEFYIQRGRLLASVLQNGVKEDERLEAQRLLNVAHASGLYFGTAELRALLDP